MGGYSIVFCCLFAIFTYKNLDTVDVSVYSKKVTIRRLLQKNNRSFHFFNLSCFLSLFIQ